MSIDNLIKASRAALGLSQSEFGTWLQKQMKLDKPISRMRISEYERGVKSPRRKMREVCLPIVASYIAKDAKLKSECDIKRDIIEMTR